GTEVLRHRLGSPGEDTPHDVAGTEARVIQRYETFDLSPYASLLHEGENVVAIQSAIGAPNLPRFVLDAGILAGGPKPGRIFASPNRTILLGGQARIPQTRSVLLNDEPTTFVCWKAAWEKRVTLADGWNTFKAAALDESGCAIETTTERFFYSQNQTLVGGELAADTVWRAVDGPSRVTSSLIVPAGRTLRIEPGAIIMIDGNQSIFVYGKMQALGNPVAPITFSATDQDNPWLSVVFFNTAEDNRLEHCELDGGSYIKNLQTADFGNILVVNSNLTLTGVTVRNADYQGLRLRNSRAVLANSHFEDVYAGVDGEASSLDAVGVTVRGTRDGGDAMDFDGESSPGLRIAQCRFDDITDDGLDFAGGNPVISRVQMFRISDKGISVDGSAHVIGDHILVAKAAEGVAIRQNSTGDFDHLTIADCATGVGYYAKFPGDGGGSGSVSNSIVWANDLNLRVDGESSLAVTYSIVGGPVLPPGEGNFNADPLFVSPVNDNYYLSSSSPALDAASDGSDIGALGTENPPTQIWMFY
ncbi:MAG: hypothetical protein V2A74_13860, partial [bacterium]